MTAATAEQQLEDRARALKERINRIIVGEPDHVVMSTISMILEEGLSAMPAEQQTEAARIYVDWLHERFPACRT